MPIALCWENHTCTIYMKLTIVATNGASIRTLTGKQLNYCQLQKTRLCFLSCQQSSGTLSQSCVTQLIAGCDIQSRAEKCIFVSSDKELLIIEITHYTPDTHLKCSGANHNISAYDILGMVEITLTCHCYIYKNEHILVDAVFM